METKLEQIAATAVKQRPKSVVREIRTPRSVGTGGGRPPPVTRWAPSNGCPYRNRQRRHPPTDREAASHRSRLSLRRDPPSGRDLDDGTVSQLFEELAGEMNRPSDRKRRISGYGDRTWRRN